MGKPLDIKNSVIKGAGRLAAGALGGLGGAALNYGISKYNRGASKEDQKEMAKYNYDLEMQKWNETNYKAQMQHMKDAGLSESLMYGGSGAGGSTASAMTSGGGSQESGRMQGMDIGQSAMMASTVALQNSQARKNNVEADKLEGVDTDLVGSKTRGQEIDNMIKKIEFEVSNATINTQIDVIEAGFEKLQFDVTKTKWEGSKAAAMTDNVIQDTVLKISQTNMTKAKASAITEEVSQKWLEYYRKSNRDAQDLNVAEAQMKTYLIGQGIQAGGRLISDLLRLFKPGGAIGKVMESSTEVFNMGGGNKVTNTTKSYK